MMDDDRQWTPVDKPRTERELLLDVHKDVKTLVEDFKELNKTVNGLCDWKEVTNQEVNTLKNANIDNSKKNTNLDSRLSKIEKQILYALGFIGAVATLAAIGVWYGRIVFDMGWHP